MYLIDRFWYKKDSEDISGDFDIEIWQILVLPNDCGTTQSSEFLCLQLPFRLPLTDWWVVFVHAAPTSLDDPCSSPWRRAGMSRRVLSVPDSAVSSQRPVP